MTDLLTERLQASAGRIPASLRPALETRRAAERARRVRRVVAATLAGVVVVAVALGSSLIGEPRAEQPPAIGPSPSATPGVYTLVADPFLTGDKWALFWGPGQTTTDGTVTVAPSVVRTDTDPSVIECVGDVHGLAAQEVQSATYAVGAEGGFNNEFILRYENSVSATTAFADLRTESARCHRKQSNPPYRWPKPRYRLIAPDGPIDDMFEGGVPGHPQVYAAREGNVIVLVENEGGWDDRTSVALQHLLDQALGPENWEMQ